MSIIAEYPPADGKQYDCQCARCGSSADYQRCDECEDGYNGHDCGEDCCCCLHPENNVVCDLCDGHGGWWRCMSSALWCRGNPLPDRAGVQRGQIEWFEIKEVQSTPETE